MVEAGRHSRWVEAQRKEKRQAASFAAPLDATGPQWENTAREKAVLCSCFTLSAKKNTPGLRFNWLHLFFCVSVSRLSENPAPVPSRPGGILFYLSFLLFFSVWTRPRVVPGEDCSSDVQTQQGREDVVGKHKECRERAQRHYNRQTETTKVLSSFKIACVSKGKCFKPGKIYFKREKKLQKWKVD